jgi:hypothetical protein
MNKKLLTSGKVTGERRLFAELIVRDITKIYKRKFLCIEKIGGSNRAVEYNSKHVWPIFQNGFCDPDWVSRLSEKLEQILDTFGNY